MKEKSHRAPQRTASRPMPGREKTVSTTIVPASRLPSWTSMIVVTGMRALPRAFEHDGPLREPLRPRRGDVAVAEDLQQARSDQARDDRGIVQADRRGGQDEPAESAMPGGRKTSLDSPSTRTIHWSSPPAPTT